MDTSPKDVLDVAMDAEQDNVVEYLNNLFKNEWTPHQKMLLLPWMLDMIIW